MTQFSYNFTDLPGVGSTVVTATDINNNGKVLVTSVTGGAYGNSLTYDLAGSGYTQQGGSQFLGFNDTGGFAGFVYYVAHGYYQGIYSSPEKSALVRDPQEFIFTTILTGINDAGVAVGNSDTRGFLYVDGVFTTLTGTPQAINDAGQIVGSYIDANAISHGFIYSGGAYTTIDDPLATGGTFATDINEAGNVVGYYKDVGGTHGFVYANGTFTTVDNPLGVGTTMLTGVNDAGQISGNYTAADGHSQAFYGQLNFSLERVATTAYTAYQGVAPTASQLSSLVDFTAAQFAYGQKVGVADAVIYAYSALGAAMATAGTPFATAWGPGNPAYANSAAGDAKFVADAYLNVFGHAATAEQAQHFVDQMNYHESLYAASGAFGTASNVDLVARGVIYGQMLGFAAELNPFGA